LKGLPSSYDAFISRKYAEISDIITKKEDIDLNKLVTELILEKNRIQNFIKDDDKTYIVRSPKNKPYYKAKHCKNCSQINHLKAECW
jgi:hypothetical protein